MTAKLWDAKTFDLQRAFEGHTGYVRSVAISSDKTLLLTSSDDNSARLWDTSNGKLLRKFQIEKMPFTGPIYFATFSPDISQILTVSWDKIPRLWDVKTEEIVRQFQGHSHEVNSAVFSPSGTNILTSSNDDTAKLWSVLTKQVITLKGHTNRVNSAMFHHDERIITTSTDGTAKIWNWEGTCLQTLDSTKQKSLSPHIARMWGQDSTFQSNAGIVKSSSLSSNHLLIASERYARMWDVDVGNVIQEFYHDDWVNSAVFSTKDETILTGCDGALASIWDSKGGKRAQTFRGHDGHVTSAVFSPDGTKILTSSRDNTVKLWDIRKSRCMHTIKDHNGWVPATFVSREK